MGVGGWCVWEVGWDGSALGDGCGFGGVFWGGGSGVGWGEGKGDELSWPRGRQALGKEEDILHWAFFVGRYEDLLGLDELNKSWLFWAYILDRVQVYFSGYWFCY